MLKARTLHPHFDTTAAALTRVEHLAPAERPGAEGRSSRPMYRDCFCCRQFSPSLRPQSLCSRDERLPLSYHQSYSISFTQLPAPAAIPPLSSGISPPHLAVCLAFSTHRHRRWVTALCCSHGRQHQGGPVPHITSHHR